MSVVLPLRCFLVLSEPEGQEPIGQRSQFTAKHGSASGQKGTCA